MKTLRHILLILLTTLVYSASYAQPNQALNRYIVVLKPDAQSQQIATEIAQNNNGHIGFIYQKVLNGFSISIPEAALKGISNNPNVAYIEEDIKVTVSAQSIPTGIRRIFTNPTSVSINNTDDFHVDADVAVLDTGIDVEHPDLNVVGGANCLNYTNFRGRRSYYCDTNLSYDDDHYHGTHVAGTIAALDNDFGVVGVAPGARLWALKVLDSSGSGSLSGIIAAIDWVVNQGNIEVINMSLGGSGQSTAMNTAIESAFSNGVFVVVAAGNSDADSQYYTPANAPFAFTISALADYDGLATPIDSLAYFSNWGDPVNMVAPGVNIYSTFPLERNSYSTISGTSMATPHVAGAAALLASNGDSPSTIKTLLINSGNYNWLDNSGDAVQEPLLDISSSVFVPTLIAANGVIENNPPTALFSFSCTELTCSFDATNSNDSDGNVSSYSWEFGDGTSSAYGATTSHDYATNGTYSVTLTVTDNQGAQDILSQDVTVEITGDGPVMVTQSINQGKYWYATVSYANNDPISGTWSNGGSCSTNQCVSNDVLKKQSSIVFTDANGVSVNINKP